MADEPLRAGGRYLVKQHHRARRGIVEAICDRVDVNTLRPRAGADGLALNDIGRVRLRTSGAARVRRLRTPQPRTGAFILIDEATNDTVGAGMVE